MLNRVRRRWLTALVIAAALVGPHLVGDGLL